MGFAPTSAGLSGGVGAVECRAVLATIDGVNLDNALTDQQHEARQEWLAANSYIDDVDDSPTAEDAANAYANIRSACGGAQQTRSVWMVLTAVLGTGLALGLGLARRADPSAAPEEAARG
jgi:sensor c-di-GMP phosphodiesterase-like protein